MMSGSTTPSAPAGAEPNQFELKILSPSLGVPQPLVLNLSASTTVGQLKERIRNAVSSKPPDNAQRLIHRGRLLARETETMSELFGEDLRSSDHQTLHLVLRDLSEQQGPAPPLASSYQTSSHSQIPTPPLASGQQTSAGSQASSQQHQQHQQHHPHNGQHFVRLSAHPNIAFGFPQAPGALNGTQLPPGTTTQQLMQNQIQTMARLSLANQNLNQHQNPVPGLAGHHGSQNWGGSGSATPGRAVSPFPPETTRTVVREGLGPDGQRWRFTVNESIVASAQRSGRTGSPFPSSEAHARATSQPRPASNTASTGSFDTPNIFRPPDAGSATRVIADAMRRNASSSSLANLASFHNQQPIPPGVTTPLIQSRTGSTSGTPDPLRAAGRPINTPAGLHSTQPPAPYPEAYILASPTGPRAILVNGSLGTYYTPTYQPTDLYHPPVSTGSSFGPAAQVYSRAFPQILPRPSLPSSTNPHLNPDNPSPGQQPHLQPQHEAQAAVPIQPQADQGMGDPQILGARIAEAMWPHLWMIVRLLLFVWWFTSPTASWSRWITVVSIAIALFIANTGVLNPLAEQFWIPARHYFENLIPLAVDANGRQQQPPAGDNLQDGNGINPARPRDLDPADAAARLVQQRRQDNANWLLNQARRLERAGILFLASLAPGFAERHIAQIEAEARAERQRLQEAEAAAVATAEASSEDTSTTATVANREGDESTPNTDLPGHEAGPSGGAVGQDAATPA